jgi:hypothetical protein
MLWFVGDNTNKGETRARLVQTDTLLSLGKLKISVNNQNGIQIDDIIR